MLTIRPKNMKVRDKNGVFKDFPAIETKVDKTGITLGKHTDGLIYIFIGGIPVGNGLSISGGTVNPDNPDNPDSGGDNEGDDNGGDETTDIYGQPLVDNLMLSMVQKSTAILGVKLDAEPTQNQTITILSDSDVLSFDKEILEFTVENWNIFQYVTVTAGTFSESQTVNITLRNSDKLLTETSIPVALKYDSYSVDTTIPTEGQHVVNSK